MHDSNQSARVGVRVVQLGTVLATLVALAALLSAGGTGCAAEDCTTDEDCDRYGGALKVCVEGACHECAEDGDCGAGLFCFARQCSPCTPDDPCAGGLLCVDADGREVTGRRVATPPFSCR